MNDEAALEAVRVELTKGLSKGKLRAARKAFDAVTSPHAKQLGEALDALVAMEKAEPAEAFALAEQAEALARTYWNEVSDFRPPALTAIVVAEVMAAKYAAALGNRAVMTKKLRMAAQLQAALVRGAVRGVQTLAEALTGKKK